MTLRTSRNLAAGMENNLQQQRYHSTVTPHQLNSALPSLPSVSPPRTERLISREDIIPEDIREMTIRNLDTGEVFVIGENDPDFEFDTFPLSADGFASNGQKHAWYRALFHWLFKRSSPSRAVPENGRSRSVAQIDQAQFSKLSSFKFRRELGRGAFGRVLLAESKVNGQLYAIKIMSKKNMRLVDKQQALAERDILLAMAHACPHPFTTGLKFAFQSENNLYIGMTFLPGGNLKQLIQRFGCLPEEWACFYAAELVLAISHLHSMRVLYRDIKPHNVMIDAEGHIILIDYGLAKQDVSHPNGAISLVGTPDYSAPEILKTAVTRLENEERIKKGKRSPVPPADASGEYGYGMAADWWSVGVMIYEMLRGVPCFHGDDLKQTYQRVLYGELRFLPEDKFSPPARELISGLLRRDPRERLGSCSGNPLQEIQACTFFRSVDWDALLLRSRPGPWVPPSATSVSATSVEREKGKGAPHPHPALCGLLEDVTESENGEEDENLSGFDGGDCSGSHSSPLPCSDYPPPSTCSPCLELSCTERASDLSEALTVNDSIIATGDRPTDPNRLPRWSFMDDDSLRHMTHRTIPR